MLRKKVVTDKNDRHIVGIAGQKSGIVVDIDFPEARAECRKYRRDD